MQYLFISEQNRIEVRQAEEFELGKMLFGEEEKTIFTVPKWYHNHLRVTRERADKMIKREESVEEVRQFMETQSKVVQMRRKGYRKGFCLYTIPPRYTGGKHLSIAFQQGRWCNPQQGNCLSSIISLCLNETIKGRYETKNGDKIGGLQYYGYRGFAVIFDDWTNPFLDHKRKKPVKFELDPKPKSKITFVQERDFHLLLQIANHQFQIQYQLNQLKTQEKAEKIIKNRLQKVERETTLPSFQLKEKKEEKEEEENEEQRRKLEGMWWFCGASVDEGGFTPKEMEEWVVNPLTKRKIKVGGKIYIKLKEEGSI